MKKDQTLSLFLGVTEMAGAKRPREALRKQAQTKQGDADNEAMWVFAGLLINSSLICVDIQPVQLQLEGHRLQSKSSTA